MERYRLKDFFKDATDIVAVNFLFLMTIILSTGLLFGPAFKALFSVTFKVFKHHNPINLWKDYWFAFKESFWLSSIVWWISIIFGTLFAFVIHYGLGNQMTWLAASGIVSAIFLVIYLLYFYPILSVFKTESNKQMLKNTAIMAFSNPFTSLLLIGGLAMVIMLIVVWSGTLLFSFGLLAVVNGFHLNRLFFKYQDSFESETEVE